MSATWGAHPTARRIAAGAGAGVLALALLGGCGSGDAAEPDAESGSAESGSAEPDTAAPEAGRGGDAPDQVTRTASPEDVAEPGLSAREVATGITSPWGLVELDGGDLLVNERDTGRILRVSADSGETSELRTLPGVRPGGEAGLLGLAMSPDQEQVLAYYTTAEDSRVVSMSWDGTALAQPEVLFGGIPTGAGYHQGGRIVVGPDDLLYIGTGDNGVPGDAQDTDSLSGKILRVTLDGDPAPENPSGNAVYSYGHRNVEGLAFDDQGRLWAAEFGDAAWDEVNLIEPGGNYGWPEVEGTGGGKGLLDPVAVWRTADASPSGLAYWDGSLWLAALRGARLWEIPVGQGARRAQDPQGAHAPGADAEPVRIGKPVSHLAGEYGRLRTVLASADGSLLLSTSNTDGRGEAAGGDDRVLRLSR